MSSKRIKNEFKKMLKLCAAIRYAPKYGCTPLNVTTNIAARGLFKYDMSIEKMCLVGHTGEVLVFFYLFVSFTIWPN